MKWLKLLVLAILAVGVISPLAYAQDVQNFSFDSFSADYYLSREADHSSRLLVNETLAARFPDYDQNHGILRAIPEQYEDHTLSLKIQAVTDETGAPYHYTTSHQNHNLVLKIGDADKYVHGLKVYKISYSMHDAIGFRNGHDDFFWDINGDQWAQPFSTVTANIHIEKQLAASITGQPICFAGIYGSQAQNCTIDQKSDSFGPVFSATAAQIRPGQTLSFRTSFKPGSFAKSQTVKREERLRNISLATGGVLLLGLPLAAFIFMFRRWRQFGDDPKGRGVIIPEYEPPKGLDALTSDYLYKQQLRPTAITALILELAVQGFLSITEIPKSGLFGSKDYQLTIEKTPVQASPTVMNLLLALFDNITAGTAVKLSELKKKQATLSKVFETLEKDLSKLLYTQGYFLKDPRAVKTGYQIWAAIIFAAAWAVGYVAFKIENFALIGLCSGLSLAAAIVFIYSFFMPARSEQGVMAYDQMLGLKDYIKLAETDRINYLQSPEGAEKIQDRAAFNPQEPAAKIKLFEKLLPYAVLFGLEKDWAKQFNNIYTTAPGWYNGNWTAFNAGYLASSLGDFNSLGGQVFSTPSSSGGGGAGGGGGGGGGGGW